MVSCPSCQSKMLGLERAVQGCILWDSWPSGYLWVKLWQKHAKWSLRKFYLWQQWFQLLNLMISWTASGSSDLHFWTACGSRALNFSEQHMAIMILEEPIAAAIQTLNFMWMRLNSPWQQWFNSKERKKKDRKIEIKIRITTQGHLWGGLLGW